MKRLLNTTALVAATLIAAPAMATDINIQDFVGKITIVEGSDGLTVVRAGEGDLQYRQSSDLIEIDGNTTRKERGETCNGPGGNWNISIGGWSSSGETRLEDQPELEISVPAGSSLAIKDSYTWLIADVDLGDANLEIGGCYDTTLANTTSLTIEKSGSGDIEAGTTGPTRIEKSGAGDIDILATASFTLEQSGAGDVEIETITGPANIEKNGSGDVEIERLFGNLSVEKSGSGDVDVDGGDISTLLIRNSGSGDVNVHADIIDADVRGSGSGDIYVKSVSGTLTKQMSGSADFNRGDD